MPYVIMMSLLTRVVPLTHHQPPKPIITTTLLCQPRSRLTSTTHDHISIFATLTSFREACNNISYYPSKVHPVLALLDLCFQIASLTDDQPKVSFSYDTEYYCGNHRPGVSYNEPRYKQARTRYAVCFRCLLDTSTYDHVLCRRHRS